MDYLKADVLKEGYLYRIEARNGNFGIWLGIRQKMFALSRYGWGSNFIDGEYHYDLDKHYGTAKPIEEIERSPFDIEDIIPPRKKFREILRYLNKFETELIELNKLDRDKCRVKT